MEKELDAEKGANVQANGSFLYNCYFRTCSDAECTEIKGIGHITTHAGGAVQFDASCNPHACPSNMMAKTKSCKLFL